MQSEQVYTVCGDAEHGFAAFNLLGELSAAGETFAACCDSILNRQRSGWLAPGPIHRRPDEEPMAQGEAA